MTKLREWEQANPELLVRNLDNQLSLDIRVDGYLCMDD